jgi:hypothetical protein
MTKIRQDEKINHIHAYIVVCLGIDKLRSQQEKPERVKRAYASG